MNLDYDSKELRITIDSEIFRLHPLWIRERSIEESAVDQSSMQRLYDPEKISVNLEIKDVKEVDESKIFYENEQTVDTNYTVTANNNAMSAGLVTVASGVTVTLTGTSVWTIV